MTFEKWWAENGAVFEDSGYSLEGAARAAWEAERERCVALIATREQLHMGRATGARDQDVRNENYVVASVLAELKQDVREGTE